MPGLYLAKREINERVSYEAGKRICVFNLFLGGGGGTFLGFISSSPSYSQSPFSATAQNIKPSQYYSPHVLCGI
jgi:hypothetical protein